MSKVVNGIVVGVAGFVLLVATVWYATVARQPDKITVTDIEHRWQGADATAARLEATITFANRHDIEVRFLGASYSLRVGDETLASSEVRKIVELKPRETHAERFLLEIPTDFVAGWWSDHVAADERSEAHFAGEAKFRVGGDNQTVRFSSDPKWDTRLRESLQEALQNCPQPGPDPCIRDADLRWSAAGNRSTLGFALDLQNPGEGDLIVSREEATLAFGGHQVATGSRQGDRTLGPGDVERFNLDLPFDPSALEAWWQQHVGACEKTSVELTVKVTYAEDDILPEESPSPTPTTTTPAPTNTSEPPANSTGPSPTTSEEPGDAFAGPERIRLRLTSFAVEQAPDGAPRTVTWTFQADDLRSEFACSGG